MKVMFDLDPKTLKKLETLATSKQLSIGEFTGELIFRTLNRDTNPTGTTAISKSAHAADSSASGRLAPPPATGIDDSTLIMLLEPLIARFKLCDADGSNRRAVMAELQMLLPDTTAAKVLLLLKRSLD
jgi:hypothetical protein